MDLSMNEGALLQGNLRSFYRETRLEPELTMDFPPTFQDEFSLSAEHTNSTGTPTEGEWATCNVHGQSTLAGKPLAATTSLPTASISCFYGDPVLTCEAVVQGTSQSDDQRSTLYKPTELWYDTLQSLSPPALNGTQFPMFFEGSNQATKKDILANQPTPLSSHAPSSTMLNIPMNVVAAPPASTAAPPTFATNVTARRRFRCPLCPKTFDRHARAEACCNKHLEQKPHLCKGACGKAACNAEYRSVEKLRRHLSTKRKAACPYWCVAREADGRKLIQNSARSLSRQNISRHKKGCVQGRPFELMPGGWM